MKRLNLFASVCFSAVLSAHALAGSMPVAGHTTAVMRAVSESLASDYAKYRKQQIKSVDYQLAFHFDKQQQTFSGNTLIELELAQHYQQPLTIDFEKGDIKSIKINGKDVSWQYEKWFITLNGKELHPGKNRIEISYSRPYSTDGSGLHRFVDPQDGEVYLYSDFEPYDANRLFPHFDQPDLKATFTSTVTAPADWQVISTTREDKISEQHGEKVWHFPRSKKIASYVYSMHAGPYQQWQDKFENIPLRLFARKSIAQYVKPQDWFKPTKQSFAFYNKYFDFAYPFGKYDQIMAPDFNSGAMENVAAVTFNENYVSRGEKSIAKKRDLANTIAHEMAHMWFGDLVTMKWWNGLWLNESFATYMANLELSKASDFDGVWDNFYAGTKQWAYGEDQSVNTHAIELPVANTAEAFSNFDGITYGKGASVLKQIPYLLGEENFRLGVAQYLKKYAYQNTSLDDFIAELGKAADKDLTSWTQQWLYQAGLNTLQADYQCQAGKISSFVLQQSAPSQYPTLREQRVQVGLYTLNNDELTASDTIAVVYQGAKTAVAAAIGKACPDLVYPNADDWGFVKVALDDRSLQTLRQHINGVSNNTLRLMLWQSLWDSVLDAKLPLEQYVKFALTNAAAEQDDIIVRKISGHLVNAYGYLIGAAKAGKNVKKYQDDIEAFAWQQLQQSAAGSEQQKIWFPRLISVSHSNTYLKNLYNLLNGEITLAGFVLDQDKRWKIVKKLNQFQYGDYEALLARESANDQSDSGIKSAIAAEVLRPVPEIKAKWFNVVLNNPDKLKLSTLRGIMYSLFPLSQSELMKPFEAKILAAVPQLNNDADLGFLRSFADYLVPATCSPASVSQLSNAVEQFAGMKPQVVKAYKGSLQEDQRCVNIVSLVR